MWDKETINKKIEQEKVELERVKSYAPTKHSYRDIIQLVIVFIVVFLVIFAFKVGKTMLVESDNSRPGYVTYRECVDSDSDYSKFGARSSCIEYRTRSLTITQRLREHFGGSLLVPSILLVIYMLYQWEQSMTSKKNIQSHKDKLAYLYEELEKVDKDKS